MSAIIQKLNALNKLDITLPICNESLQINKINLETQSKFEEFGRNTENELYTSSQYIQFINNHIKKEVKRDLNYIDKLYVIQQWYNDIKKEDPIECELSTVEISDYNILINDTDVVVKFELPTLSKELAYLKYIITNKKTDMMSIDILFYFIFRFIKSITIEDDTVLAEDIDTSEQVYKLLSMTKVTSITEHIDSSFKAIESVRNLEVDPRVFFA
tara:strand:- start:825 stop:1469 length:645 start_codon:yes stop_codon:yes gene_type:complete